MALEWLSRLAGTMQTKFGIGGPSSAVNLKNASGVLQIRNAADSAHADIGFNAAHVKDAGTAYEWILEAPTLAASQTLILPTTHGSTGQSLKRGSGDTTEWADDGANSDHTIFEQITQASSSPVTLLATPPDNYTIIEVIFEVTVAAASGNAPTVSVGVAGTVAKYVLTTDVDLHTTGIYKVTVLVDESTSPADVIITIVPDSRSFSCDVYFTYNSPV